jgi:hypothetical protein
MAHQRSAFIWFRASQVPSRYSACHRHCGSAQQQWYLWTPQYGACNGAEQAETAPAMFLTSSTSICGVCGVPDPQCQGRWAEPQLLLLLLLKSLCFQVFVQQPSCHAQPAYTYTQWQHHHLVTASAS